MPPREPDPVLIRILEALQSLDARLQRIEVSHAKIEREEGVMERLGKVADDLAEWLRGQQAAVQKLQAEKQEGRSALLDIVRVPYLKELIMVGLSALATWSAMRYGAPITVAAPVAQQIPIGGQDASSPSPSPDAAPPR